MQIMRVLSIVAIAALSLSATFASADEVAAAGDCAVKEASLAKFYANGKEVAPNVIGVANPCDDFGGDEVFTTRNQIRIFVNFNIAVSIDLDQVDTAFENGVAGGSYGDAFKQVHLIIVAKDWIKQHHQSDSEISLSMAGQHLFISERAIQEGRLIDWLNRFYSLK